MGKNTWQDWFAICFLMPGIITVVLVCVMLNRASFTLPELPELLAMPVKEAEEPTAERKESHPALLSQPAEEPTELATVLGNYTDGVFTGSARGFGGQIRVQVTVEGGQITDITVLSAAGETDSFFNRAMGVVPQVLQRQTWEVDTISGATYSSRGILGAIQNALTGERVVNEAPQTDEKEPPKEERFQEPAAYRDGTYRGSAQGFGGTITVEVVIRDGIISGISIVSASRESGSYLRRAKAVIQRIIEAQSPNVDGVSGATYSSSGIINAVKRALSKAALSELPTETPTKALTESPTTAEPAAQWKDGIYIGTGDGFGGPITVKVKIEGGRIRSVGIVSARHETAAYLKRAKALLKRIVSAQSGDIDGISGATYSSQGILQAVRQALAQAEPASEEPTELPTVTPAQPDVPGDPAGNHHYRDGTYSATGWCSDADETFLYELTVHITVEDGVITQCSVQPGEDWSSSPESNDAYYHRVVIGTQSQPGIPAQIIAAQGTNGVDAVSRATYTSQTVLSLAQQALAKAVAEDTTELPTEELPPTETSTEEPLPTEMPTAEEVPTGVEPPAESEPAVHQQISEDKTSAEEPSPVQTEQMSEQNKPEPEPDSARDEQVEDIQREQAEAPKREESEDEADQ